MHARIDRIRCWTTRVPASSYPCCYTLPTSIPPAGRRANAAAGALLLAICLVAQGVAPVGGGALVCARHLVWREMPKKKIP